MRTDRRVAALVMTASLAGACASQDDKVAFPAARPEAAPGGTLVLSITPPASLDPALTTTYDRSGSLVLRTMCDPLIGLDPKTGALVPALAERWEVTDGGKRLIIKLQEDLTFSDGSSFDARDVAASLTRVAARDTGSPVADLLAPIAGYEDVHDRPDEVPSSRSEQLSGIRVIETNSFEIVLSEPRADFLRVLTHPLAMPVSTSTVDADTAEVGVAPLCVGPYQLAKPFEPGRDDVVRLVRSEAYYAQNQGFTRGGLGWADEIEFRIVADLATEAEAFIRKTVDVAHAPSTFAPSAMAVPPIVVRGVTPVLEYIGLPTTVAPFDDPGVRVAFSQALDRQKLVETVYGGSRQAARGFLPPALGDQLHRDTGCGALAPATADLAAARASLASTGVRLTGQTVRLFFNDEFGHREFMEAVGLQWQEAFGIVPELVPMAWQEYLETGRRGDFDGPFRLSWQAEAANPDQYLAPLFSETSVGATNISRFSDLDFEVVLERSAREADDEGDRQLAYLALEDLVCDGMPVIPVDYGALTLVVDGEAIGSAVDVFTDVTTGDALVRELFLRASEVSP